MTKKKLKVKFLKKSYLAMIKNSKGTKMFANFYGQVGKKSEDLTKNGKISCALFVSSILKIFGLIEKIHLTVRGTLKDIEKSGWYLVEKPKPGSILLWEEKEFNKGEKHFHIGFYLGKKLAISNSYKKRVPIVHHWTFQNKRKIIAIYWHKKLD